MGTQRYQVLIPGTLNCYLIGKRVFAGMIKLRILRWKCYSGLPRALNKITCVLLRRGQKEVSYRHTQRRQCEDRMERDSKMLALKMEWIANNWGMPAARDCWKRRGTDWPPEPLEGAWPCQDLDFGPGHCFFYFWPQELERINLGHFKSPSL